ncbi:MAG: TRAP transporter small permease subunit [Caldilineaceae bacterium]|nr:TRAP transporter small permease subunit [Caldilineaceae bacterium]
MKALLKFAHFIDGISERLGGISTILVVITVTIGFYNVVARYVGRYVGVNLSSNMWIETQWYLYSLIFFLAFPYILKHGDNVRVDFWYVNWPAKGRALVDFLGTLLFLVPFCILGIYVTITPVLFSWGRLPNGSWGTWELSPDPGGLPRAPIKTMIIVAFVMLLLQSLAQLVKYLAVLTGHTEVTSELNAEAASHELPE